MLDPNGKNDRSALARRDSVVLANSKEKLFYRLEPVGCPEDNCLRLRGHPRPRTNWFQGSIADWRRHHGWLGIWPKTLPGYAQRHLDPRIWYRQGEGKNPGVGREWRP